MWRRSAPNPNAPVVNRQLNRARRDLNWGNATGRPARFPALDADQFVSAVARLASLEE